MNALEAHTRRVRDSGRKLLTGYVTGGVTGDWTDHLRAMADAGADVIEVGLPFSDPMLDGPTIQRASDTALGRGSTVDGILSEVARLGLPVPLVVMTYANPVIRRGVDAFCDSLRDAGVSGLIVPDVPVDEAGPLSEAAAAAGIDLVLLVSPATTAARRRQIAGRSRGFVYAVSVMGTTGARDTLPASAGDLAQAVRAVTDLPVQLGFGVSTPAAARAAAASADGVIVASALMRMVLDGASPADVGGRLTVLREALDDPGLGVPGLGRSGLDQPGLGWPSLDQPGHGRLDLGQPDRRRPGLDQPATDGRAWISPASDGTGEVPRAALGGPGE